MENGDLVTLTLPHWDKNNAYFICRVREYVDHRGVKRFQYLGKKRVSKRKNEFGKDIYTDTTLIFEPVDIKDIEPYTCDDSGIQCDKCELCYYGEDLMYDF